MQFGCHNQHGSIVHCRNSNSRDNLLAPQTFIGSLHLQPWHPLFKLTDSGVLGSETDRPSESYHKLAFHKQPTHPKQTKTNLNSSQFT